MTGSPEPPAAPRAPQGRYPDFFIVGHAKCGTTALYEMLRAHPQIYMPSVKEPQFFARNPYPPAVGAPETPFERTGRHPESLERYLSLFTAAGADQRVGEASTFYLWSEVAPGRIAEAQSDARIIAILREPASFMRSLHLQMLQNQAESEKDLRKAIALEEVRRQGRKIPPNAHWPRALMYTDRARYAEQLSRYHAAFPREQVLVLLYEDFKADNETTVRRVLRFLEVDDSVTLEPAEANPSVSVRSLPLARMVRAVRMGSGPLSRAVRTSTKALTTARLRRDIVYPLRRRLLFDEPPPPDEELMGELRSRFKSEVIAVGEYLDRDLVALWGYENVD